MTKLSSIPNLVSQSSPTWYHVPHNSQSTPSVCTRSFSYSNRNISRIGTFQNCLLSSSSMWPCLLRYSGVSNVTTFRYGVHQLRKLVHTSSHTAAPPKAKADPSTTYATIRSVSTEGIGGREPGKTVVRLRLECTNPALTFLPGQWVDFFVPGSGWYVRSSVWCVLSVHKSK